MRAPGHGIHHETDMATISQHSPGRVKSPGFSSGAIPKSPASRFHRLHQPTSSTHLLFLASVDWIRVTCPRQRGPQIQVFRSQSTGCLAADATPCPSAKFNHPFWIFAQSNYLYRARYRGCWEANLRVTNQFIGPQGLLLTYLGFLST